MASPNRGKEGNGGAGVLRKGKSLPFSSLKNKLVPFHIEKLESYQLLMKVIENSILLLKYKEVLLSSLEPSIQRIYYKAHQQDLDAETLKKITAIYKDKIQERKVTGQITLLAITANKETFLLPNFFKLNHKRQSSLLFHEALWVINENLSYEDVLKTEAGFESFLENNKFNPDLCEGLSKAFMDPIVCLASTLVSAMEPSGNSIPLSAFLKKEIILSLENHHSIEVQSYIDKKILFNMNNKITLRWKWTHLSKFENDKIRLSNQLSQVSEVGVISTLDLNTLHLQELDWEDTLLNLNQKCLPVYIQQKDTGLRLCFEVGI